MSKQRDAFVSKKVASMSLAEKVGQLLTFTWRGTVLTPSGIEQVTKLNCGGLCLEPYALETSKNLYWGNSQVDKSFKKPKDYFAISNSYFEGQSYGVSITADEYTKRLNYLQELALARRSGIPLHMTIDFEGDFKNDYSSGGIRQFPGPMGMAAIGDPKLTYKIGLTIAKILTCQGITQMYSPVCDVNINPKNPEIGVRSFGDDPKVCAEHAVALIEGLQKGGIACTAKHFPGRGDSFTDAHDVLEVIEAPKARMRKVELFPFKAAIDAGVKCIMTGHSVYPSFDKDYPTTLSEKILQGVLRKELGFDGVIVSDAIGMAAILKKWPLPTACAMAIKAGVDTILLKADDESRSQCYFGLKMAVEEGQLPESRVDDAVTRLLKMKWDQGLFKTAGKHDPEKAYEINRDPTIGKFSESVAKKAIVVMRDNENLLPLKKKQRVLVIEQRFVYEFLGKDPNSHRHVFCERMTQNSLNVILADTNFSAFAAEIKECLQLAKQADVVVMTNYYARIVKDGTNELLCKKLKEAGHKVIVVTNTPYVEGATEDADTVVCNFSGTPDSIRASADFLYGKFKACPTTKVPVSNHLPPKGKGGGKKGGGKKGGGETKKKLKPPRKSLTLSYC